MTTSGKDQDKLTYTVCEPSHGGEYVSQASPRQLLKVITTYEVAGVSSGGGIGRGLATVHAGLDGSRPVEQAAGWTRRAGWRVYSNKQCKFNRSAKNPERLELLYRRPRRAWGEKKATKERPADWRSLEVGEEGKMEGHNF